MNHQGLSVNELPQNPAIPQYIQAVDCLLTGRVLIRNNDRQITDEGNF